VALSGHLPDLDSLALLIEVSRSGSIGAAARQVGVSQQSASERLSTMERLVGVPLLSRGARGTSPTAAGALLVEWGARLLQVAEEVDTSIVALRTDRDRELRIVASMTVAEHLLPRWLVALRQQQARHGERDAPTSVSLRAANSTEVLRAVSAGEADLGFVEGAERPSGLSSIEIGRDDLVLVASAGDRLARRRTPLTPAQVAELSLTSRERGSGTREVVEQALAAHHLTMAAPAVEVTTSTAVRESVRAGGAPAFLSRHAVETDLRARTLVVVRTSDLVVSRALRAVWVGGAEPPPGPARDLLAVVARVS
jgi:molybdate transport repressor ModE-like protein